jgi:hypothetical protein
VSLPPSRRPTAAAAAAFLLFGPLAAALVVAPAGNAFDPGLITNTTNDPNWNLSMASAFRLNLENVTPYQCPVDCTIVQSDEVRITIDGPGRLTGSFSETYRIRVDGPPSFQSNYTTIAVVLKGNASDVVLQPDGSAERTGAQAYTKDVNGSSTMNLTLLPSNRTGSVTLNVIGYVGDGNRTHHNNTEYYAIASKAIDMRAQRIILLNATIANSANVSVTSVNVSFFAKGPRDGDAFEPVGNATVAAVNANGQGEAGVAWDATWADPAVYTIKVVIDPLHQHPDAFEDNNVAFFRVNLGPPEPDTRAQLVGNAFLIGTTAVIVAVAVGLFVYNRRYE